MSVGLPGPAEHFVIVPWDVILGLHARMSFGRVGSCKHCDHDRSRRVSLDLQARRISEDSHGDWCYLQHMLLAPLDHSAYYVQVGSCLASGCTNSTPIGCSPGELARFRLNYPLNCCNPKSNGTHHGFCSPHTASHRSHVMLCYI